MKLFGRGKEKPQQDEPAKAKSRCLHPVSHQVMLHEDPTAPTRITGLKCSQCGQVLERAA